MWGIFDYSAFFNWILSNSLKASILVVLILLIKFLFRARIGARVQYLLWFVVIIGLLMPWAPKSSFSLYNLIQLDQYKISPIVEQTPTLNLPGEPSTVSEVPSQNKPDSEVTSTATPSNGLATTVNTTPDVIKPLGRGTGAWSVNNILFSLWLIIACLLAGLTVFRNKVFSQKLDARLITDEGLMSSLEEMKARLKVRSHIPLVQTSKVTTPSLYGIFRPMLLMPEKVQEKLTLDQVTYVFAHELCHFKRKDVLVNCLINALVILHWFNPIIWYMAYKMREDQEVACDAYALSYIGNDKSNDYGYTLISLLESCTKARHVTGLTSLSGSRSQLKRRVTMLKMLGKSSVKWTVLGLVIVIAISFTALTNAEALVPNTPIQNSANATEKPKVIMTVNSVQPAKLQPELVAYGRNNIEPYPTGYSFSTSDDIPSIALGAFLGGWDRLPLDDNVTIIKKQAAELVPGNPIVVKSYDAPFTDYYLIPMLKESKFVDPIVFSVTNSPGNDQKKAVKLYNPTYNGDKMEYSARDKLFDVDGSDAVDIMKQTQGITEVPAPRLVLKSDTKRVSKFDPQKFLWEFNFEANKILYVNQQGKVLDTDIVPWYEKYVSPKYDPKAVKIEPNKLTRDDGWSLNVQSIIFGQSLPNDPTLKSGTIDFSIQNNAGEDQIFMPKGSIVGIISTGGKTYPLSLELESIYIGCQELRNGQKQTAIKPGLLKLGSVLMLDSAETRFSKVMYRDEQGNEFVIPVDLTPELKISPPIINGTMEPYKIPDKDWSLAITQLQFRHNTEDKFILAALGFTLTNNSGEDTIFSPKGKILGITGTSGKFYPYDATNSSSLEQDYAAVLAQKKERAKETGQLYQPGVLTLSPESQ